MRHILDLLPALRLPCLLPDLDVPDRPFVCADDVAQFALEGGILTGQRRTHSWHLARDGRFACGTRATCSNSLADWAAQPNRLIEAFLDGRPEQSCSPIWVVIDERPSGLPDPCELPVEHDVEQYLQRQLEVAGITLVDAVVFDDQRYWWSMCELLTGTTVLVCRTNKLQGEHDPQWRNDPSSPRCQMLIGSMVGPRPSSTSPHVTAASSRSASSGNRLIRRPIATSASSRARAAPRQKWPPYP